MGAPKKKRYDTKQYPSYEKWKAINKERYHNDPEYRARKIEESKKFYQENRDDPEFKMVRSIKRRERYLRDKLKEQ